MAESRETSGLRMLKKEPLKAALKLFHREASKRVDRSHSRPKLDNPIMGRKP
jgi:hypothetical protein